MASTGGSDSGLPSSLAAAIALAVAGLAAIGLTGEALVRAVRNEPDRLSGWLILALVGGGLFAILKLIPVQPPAEESVQTSTDKEGNTTSTTKTVTQPHSPAGGRWRSKKWWVVQWASVVALALLIFAVAGTINRGADAISARERPSVALQAAPRSAAGVAEVTVTARAVGLTVKQDLMVQVLGLSKFTGVTDDAVKVCEQEWHVPITKEPPDPDEAQVLLWARVGPRADGSVDTSWKLQIPKDIEAVCVFTPTPPNAERGDGFWRSIRDLVLNSEPPGEPPAGDNNSAAYLRIT